MTINSCQHIRSVTVFCNLVSFATYYEPAEYEAKACCDECGKFMDMEDIPSEAKQHDSGVYQSSHNRTMPHEFYD